MKRLALAALVIAMFLAPAMVVGAEESVKDKMIGPNKHYADWILGASKDDEISVDFTSDANVDLYIISSDEYGSGLGTKYPANFTVAYQVLNTKDSDFKWKVPDSQSYYFIVDNEVNNNIPGSANPTGNVTFSYTRSDPFAKRVEELGTAISTFCIMVVVVVVIIVVVIIVVIILLVRKKKQPVAAQPAPGGAMYGAPAQPPAQYPQQPGQYTPPPPPPGSPGVPPPPGQ